MLLLAEFTAWDFWALLAKIVVYLACFLAIGSTLYTLATPHLDDALKQQLRQIVMAFVVVGVIGSAVQFGVQSGRLLDEGFVGMFDGEMLALVKDAPLGSSIFVRLVGLTMLAAFSFQIPVAGLFGVVGSGITAASFSLVGHTTGDPRFLLAALVTLHLIGVSFWIGALWPLRKIASKYDLEEVSNFAHRFGQQAAWVVSGLIAVGLILAVLITGSPIAMFTSQYGLTLLIKIAVVAALLALAAINKLRLVPAMQRGEKAAAMHLRQSIFWEMLAIMVILVITAVLTTLTPLPETMEMIDG